MFKTKKIIVIAISMVMTMGTMFAQSTTPISDFECELSKDGTYVWIKRYLGKDVNIIIPSEVEGFPVRELSINSHPYGFFERDQLSKIVSVTLPNSIDSVPRSMFEGCSKLRSVILQNGLKEIGYKAFSGCKSLESIVIPATVEIIESAAFYDCSALKKIEFPQNIKHIGEHAFANCTSLTKIKIPDSCEWLGRYVFRGCDSLVTVNIPAATNGLITERCFSRCSSLTEVIIPDSITSLFDNISFSREDISTAMESAIEGGRTTAFEDCTKMPISQQAKLRKLGYTGSF